MAPWDARQLAKLLNLLILFFLSTMAFSITPYFSSEAKTRFNMRESWIGYTFAAFPLGYVLSVILCSFADVYHLTLRSIARAVRATMLVDCIVSILFALGPTLYDPPSSADPRTVGLVYTTIFASCRFAQGATVAVMDVAIMIYCTKLFPGHVSEVVGENEAVNGLGVMLGPPIGGLLFKVGGFSLPLLVTSGTCVAICAITTLLTECHAGLKELHQYSTIPRNLLPQLSDLTASIASADDVGGEEGEAAVTVTLENIKQVLQMPFAFGTGAMLVSGFSIACFAFCEALSPLYFYDRYGVVAWEIGLVMAGVALVYAVVAVTAGRLVGGKNAWTRPLVMVGGLVLLGASMFLTAPAFAEVNIEGARHELAASITGLLILGGAMAIIQVASVAMLVDTAKAIDKKLVPAAGAFSNFGMSLGGLLGPVVGSHLAEQLGFVESFFVFCVVGVFSALGYGLCYMFGSHVASSTGRPQPTRGLGHAEHKRDDDGYSVSTLSTIAAQ